MLIYILGAILAGFFLFVCVPARLALFNFLKVVFYVFVDVYHYFKWHSFNSAPVGFIDIYCGLFGRGKTLSAVHYVVRYYHKYNNRRLYDPIAKKWVVQYVQVLSNVTLSIPYKELKSFDQIVDINHGIQQFNQDNNCRLVTIVLGDEFSVQANSRNFKTNFNSLFLNALLTCRHANTSLVLTSQRFAHCDALLRQVTSHVIECNKLWRFQVHNYFDAWDLEQAGSSLKLKPIRRTGFFVTNKDYNNYDTTAFVDNLIKDYHDGSLLSEETILALQGNLNVNEDNARSISRRYRKRRSK